ncbi:MAG: hypothetical protein AAFV37_03575 [Pseudomonadota bacterium]
MNTDTSGLDTPKDSGWLLLNDDCCETQEGQANPLLSVTLWVSVDGQTLTLDVETEHPCGIKQVDIDLRIITSNAEVWKLITTERGSFSWAFSPQDLRQLPEPIGVSASVIVLSISDCGTFARETRRTYLF